MSTKIEQLVNDAHQLRDAVEHSTRRMQSPNQNCAPMALASVDSACAEYVHPFLRERS